MSTSYFFKVNLQFYIADMKAIDLIPVFAKLFCALIVLPQGL